MFTSLRLKKRLLIFFLSLVISLCTSQAWSDEYAPLTLFGESESGVFHDLSSGKLLKPVIENNRTVYLEQDGDIFDEDVATLDDASYGLSNTYSFDRSKRLLATEIYTDHLLAFYSGCRYRLYLKKFVPVASSCGFKYRKNKSRSERIEWEHIVPAWHFGHQLQCWQNGGRLHCRKTNEQFRQMEADMHNLVPAIGEINGDRSNYKYSMVSGEPRAYGTPVNMEIVFKSRIAEPPESVQGDIARTYFYMAKRYNLQISAQQKQLFIAWNNLDPVDDWERQKNQRVKAIQGDENTFITDYKKLDSSESIAGPEDDSAETSLTGIHQSLKERFSFLFDYLPVQIVEGLLLLTAVYLLWRHRRKKAVNNTSQETSEQTLESQYKAEKRQKTNDETTENKEPASQQSYVKIQSVMNKFVLALDDDGKLVVERSSRAHAQRWRLEATNKTEGFLFLQHIESGMVLAVEDGLKKDDAAVVPEQQKRRSNNHQEWRLIDPDSSETDDTSVFIENRATSFVLDISDKNTKESARVASYHRKTRGTENQRWIIKPYS